MVSPQSYYCRALDLHPLFFQGILNPIIVQLGGNVINVTNLESAPSPIDLISSVSAVISMHARYDDVFLSI